MHRPQVWVGWDSREAEAYDVCKYSIKKHCPQAIVEPIVQSDLRRKGVYTREPDLGSATEFSLTRFLTPYLMDYSDWAIFCDCDFLWTCDVKEIFELADPRYAVQVVKHMHDPFWESTKMDAQKQMKYERKNWSSLILWNCGHEKNRNLTKEVINTVSPAFLHRFWHLRDEDIGELPLTYNFLSMYYNKLPDDQIPKVIHYTSGMPFMSGYENCDYADIWYKYRDEMNENRNF
jgi:lipopolysaccharide biosynthesis glycosyltransferase